MSAPPLLLGTEAQESKVEVHNSLETKLGGLTITRALPVRGRRTVGPWCFLDRFGPVQFADGKPMDVGAHPHMGLQTVSWILEGEAAFDGEPLHPRTLYCLAPGRTEGTMKSAEGARVLLVGGPPFEEIILMWWNFVARTPDEIRQARADWEGRLRFGDIPGFRGERIAAPAVLRLSEPKRPAV